MKHLSGTLAQARFGAHQTNQAGEGSRQRPLGRPHKLIELLMASVVVASSLVVVAGIGSDGVASAVSSSPIKIGVLVDEAPSTDYPLAPGAAQAAGTYINDVEGGIHGHHVQIITCDDLGTPESDTQCAETFVSDHVLAAAGYLALNEPQFIQPLVTAGIPVILQAATSAGLASPGVVSVEDGVFSVLLLAAAYGKQHNLLSSEMLIPQAAASIQAVDLASPLYSKEGIKFGAVYVPNDTSDYTSVVEAATTSHPATLSVLGATPQFTDGAVQAAHTLGYTGKIIANVSQSEAKTLGSLVDPLIGTYNYSDGLYLSSSDNAKYVSFMKDHAKNVPPFGNNVLPIFQTVTLVGDMANRTPAATLSSSTLLATFKDSKNVSYFLDAGVPLNCGAKPISLAPSICTSLSNVVGFKNGKEVKAGSVNFAPIVG